MSGNPRYVARVIRLVLFDIDGTLLRTGGAGLTAFNETGQRVFGIANGTAHMSFAGRTDTSLMREFFRSHDLPASEENFRRFLATYLELLGDRLTSHTGGICPGAIDLISQMEALPEPPLIGLQTGNVRRGAEMKLRYYGLWDRFQTGGFGDDSEDRNQLAAIARDRGSERLGRTLDGAEVLVIGDTPQDIACGRSIGARVLAVGTGGATLEILESHRPDWVVADLRHVTASTLCT